MKFFVIAVLVYFVVSFIMNVLILGAAIYGNDREQCMSAIFRLVIAIVWIIAAAATITFG